MNHAAERANAVSVSHITEARNRYPGVSFLKKQNAHTTVRLRGLSWIINKGEKNIN